MESSAAPLPAHQFQAQNSHYSSEPPPQYGPHQSHQSQPASVQHQQQQQQQPAPVASQPSSSSSEPKPPASAPAPAPGGTAAAAAVPGAPGPPPGPVSTSTPTVTPVSKERTRHSSACFPCAKRKVKCDRDVKNPCSNCLKRDQGHLCEVKSQKDRLSHGRPDGSLGRDGHRDKRPKFEAYQSTFRSTPAASNGYVPPPEANPLTMSPPQARMTEYDSPDYRLPRAHRTSVSMVSRKTDEGARWEAIEELLPPRKDLLKYINTYRHGPHALNPITRNFDAIESQVCILLEEIGTAQMRQRLSGAGMNAEVELNRLARLLAVLAVGARVDDSDGQTQRMIAQDYVRKAFRCLQLANHTLRPTTETAETLFMLAHELANEYQSGLSWTTLGAASRIVQLRDTVPSHYDTASANQYDQPHHPSSTAGGVSPDHAVAMSIALQDAILSLVLRKANPSHLAQLKHHSPDAPHLGVMITAVLIDVYAAIPDPLWTPGQQQHVSHDVRWPPAVRPALWPEALQNFHSTIDAISRSFPLADISTCKTLRDRHEHYAFRLHVSYAIATVQRAALPDRALSPETQESPAGRRLEYALHDILRAFIDFSAISNLPVRSWWMVHFALDAALESCGMAQAPEAPFISVLLPRLLSILEAGAVPLMGKRHHDALAFLKHVLGELEGAGAQARLPPEELRRDVAALRGQLCLGDDIAPGGGLVQQAFFGL